MMKSWPNAIFMTLCDIFSPLWQLNVDFYKAAHKTKTKYFNIHLKIIIKSQLWLRLGAGDTVS